MDDQRHFSAPASSGTIVALVVNLFLPGVGTILGGKGGLGAGQLVMFILGIPMLFFFFPLGLIAGLAMIIGSWVWGVITGVQMMSASTTGSSGPPSHFS